MGKKGPCCHCGATSTPLWRNGPSEKPVLCNACGSRWRTKGSLANYTPLHLRAAEQPDDFEDYHQRASYKVKAITPVKKHKETSDLKRKFDNNHVTDYGVAYHPQYNNGGQHQHRKGLDEDMSNRSSSGSAISNSDSCAQYGTADASDLTGPTQQPNTWDSTMPSRKRTCITTRRKPSPVEKLTKDLYTIWQEQQSSCLSVSTEDDLLLVTDNPTPGSVEFGHGSVLIRNPHLIAREEESEASSLPNDHKKITLINSQRLSVLGQTGVTGGESLIRGTEKIKKQPADEAVDVGRTRRDNDQLEKLQILAHHNSPLCLIDLQDIVNFDVFTSQFTNDEQQKLLKFLAPIDTMEAPQRLKSMFDSPQFKENLLSFQKLLAGGVFDSSLSGFSSDNCRILKKLLLCTPTKSKWVEQYEAFKDVKGKTSIEESKFVGGFNTNPTTYSATKKRPQDGQLQKLAGAKVGMKNLKRVPVMSTYVKKEQLDNDETFLGRKRAISLQNNNGSLLCDSYVSEKGSEQDLLIDLPSNSSFPQAELLLPTTSVEVQASTSCSSVYPNNIHR